MISVTVPVFNEVESIVPLYESVAIVLKSLGTPWEMILVNDGSSDGTAAVLDKVAAADTNVKVIHLRRNFGQTAAMMAGIDFARGDIIIPMDGDLQNDPMDIPRLLAKLDEGYDVVSGWRSARKDATLTRNLPSWLANRLISGISGVHLHDYGCSLKAYRKNVIKDVKLYGEMHRFIPIYARWMGAKVVEIPVRHRARQFGASKYGLERVFKVILDLAVIKFLDRYLVKPIYVFGGAGLIMLITAFATLAVALGLRVFEGISLIQTPLPLLAVMLFLMGCISILMGLLAEMLMRTYFESQGRHSYRVRDRINTGPPR